MSPGAKENHAEKRGQSKRKDARRARKKAPVVATRRRLTQGVNSYPKANRAVL
jgi:hypothetical protein